MGNGALIPERASQIRRYLNFVTHKFRYYSWPRIILGGLYVFGIHIQPFYVMREGILTKNRILHMTAPADSHIRYLCADDMSYISEIPDYATTCNELLTRLHNRKRCLGVYIGDTLAAFSWCDLEACNFEGYRFSLTQNEAYLYDAHTLKKFRGAGLAPFVRFQMYRELEKVGRVVLYSITERFNEPAMRFKQKLHAKIIGRGMHVVLFHRWQLNSVDINSDWRLT